MRVSELITMLLVSSMFVIGGSLYLADIGSSYGVANVPNMAALNQTTDIAKSMKSMQGNMSSTNTGNAAWDAANSFWNIVGFMSSAFINTGLMFLTSPIMLTNMLTNTAGSGLLDIIGLPTWIIGIITVMVTSAILFAVYRTVAKSDI